MKRVRWADMDLLPNKEAWPPRGYDITTYRIPIQEYLPTRWECFMDDCYEVWLSMKWWKK